MENIGIDLGTSKTILTSSKNNGVILFDNLGSRSIKTILELTQPLRKFGNNVIEPRKKDIHKRKRIELTDYENLFYFINYLNTLTNTSSYTLTVPYFLTYQERLDLFHLFKAANMSVNIINDITAFGMLYALKHEQCKERFAIMDCGHSKTTFGMFERIDNVIKPITIKGIRVGGRDFDIKLIDFIMKKFSIEDTPFVREKIVLQIDKMKCSLNSIDEYRFTIEIMEEQIVIDITKEEYLAIIKDDLERMKDFFTQVGDELGDLCVEVVGGNSFNLNVRELLESSFKCSYAMDAFESASFGACFFGTILKFGSRINYKVNDLFFDNLYIRTYKSEEEREGKKLTKVFGNTNFPFDGSKVTFTKSEDFRFDLVTDNGLVTSGKVTEATGSVDLIIRISQNGIIEVDSTTGKVCIDQPDFTDFIQNEKTMKQIEQEFVQCGSMRNELEHVLMNLDIPTLTPEQTAVLGEVKDSLVFYPMCEKVAEEENIRNEVSEKLDFVTEMVRERVTKITMAYNVCFEEIEKMMKEKKNFSYIKASYKLQGMIYNKKEMLKKMKVDIFNAAWILSMNIENDIREIETLKVQCEREIVEREREEEKKAEEAKKRAEEEAKKNADEETNKKANEDTKNQADEAENEEPKNESNKPEEDVKEKI